VHNHFLESIVGTGKLGRRAVLVAGSAAIATGAAVEAVNSRDETVPPSNGIKAD